VTTLEPGARLVLTQGRVAKPRATAFSASRPAASITEGFEVLVQEVIAAITTEPWRRRQATPPTSVSISTAVASATAAPPPSPSQRPTVAGWG